MKVFDILAYIRKMLDITERESLFLVIGRTMANGNNTIGDLYEAYAESDGFLYVLLSET